MMRLRFVLTLASLFALICGTALAAPYSDLHQIRALTNADAGQHPFVAFEATVIYFDNAIRTIHLQDGSDGIFVHTNQNLSLAPGDRIYIEGQLYPSFVPFIESSRVLVLGHVPLPEPQPVTFDDLERTRIISTRIKAHGHIRAANLVSSSSAPSGNLQLLMDGGEADIEIECRNLANMRTLLDAEVEVTGVAARIFDSKLQQTGVKIRINRLSDIHVLKPAPANPWNLPFTSLATIFTGYHVHDQSTRMRVQGTITYYEPGRAAILQNGNESLWVATGSTDALRIGNRAEAIGFPDTDEGRLRLDDAQLRDTGVAAPIAPFAAHWSQLSAWQRTSAVGHNFDLVSIEGRLVSHVRAAHQDVYVLSADGKLVAAIFRHPELSIPPDSDFPTGSLIRITGICWYTDFTPTNDEVHFQILLRSTADLVYVACPPLLSVRNLVIAILLLLVILMLLGIRTIHVERKARQLSSANAEVEHRRRRILEEIFSMRPLSDILESVTTTVSMQLGRAPCWCTVADGATLGNMPSPDASARIVEHPIAARDGGSLGSLFVALPKDSDPQPIEDHALSMGAGLASVAIESRHLYNDLVHKSEFDPLTDLLNRAALHEQLDQSIALARERGTIFAVIYLDLDKFKLVNDNHGHNIGDLVLVEAARRMKSQLRPSDRLARLGGDEFTILLNNVRNRSEVEEVVHRLDRTLALPYKLEGLTLSSSASIGIAIFPEDATDRDALLNHADAAMYAVKATRSSDFEHAL